MTNYFVVVASQKVLEFFMSYMFCLNCCWDLLGWIGVIFLSI